MAFKRVIIRRVGPLSWLLDAMRNFLSFAFLILLLSSCDKSFDVKGTIVSDSAKPLTACWLIYESNGQQAESLSFPRFEGSYITHGGPYTVTIVCDGHVPAVLAVPKDGNFGTIYLKARAGI